MSERTVNGKTVTQEQIQAWADEAEAGYDVENLPKPRRGRPSIGAGPSIVVPVRLDAATVAALQKKIEEEGISRSDALRAAIQNWLCVRV